MCGVPGDHPPAAAYLPGSLKRHPDWPATLVVALRTVFDDDSPGPCKAWLDLTPGNGTNFRLHLEVADWPDVELTDTASP